MKRFLLIAPTLFASIAAFTQIPVALDRLEGRWTSGNIVSEWQFTDDYALNNRTYQIIQNDTVDISRSYVRADNNGITTLTYITPHGENYQFRLVMADVYGFTWRNVQPDALPTCIKIERNGPNKYTWSGLEETLEFKHEKEGRLKLNLGVMLGMNTSIFPQHRSGNSDMSTRQGFESALSLRLSHSNSAFGVNLESGYIQTNYAVNRNLTNANNQTFSCQGAEQVKTFYTGIVPEGHFGKQGKFTFSTGVFMTIDPQKKFTGNFKTTGYTAQEEQQLFTKANSLHSRFDFLVGMSYQPGFKIGGVKPVFYCRVMNKTAVSAGVKMGF